MFLKIGVPQNGWFIMENLIKMDDFGVPQFLETPKSLKSSGSTFSLRYTGAMLRFMGRFHENTEVCEFASASFCSIVRFVKHKLLAGLWKQLLRIS